MSVSTDSVNQTLKRRYLAHAHRLFILLFAAGWTALVTWGWSVRNEDFIHASSGLGYALGITGAGLLLVLLSYSLRKRWRPLRRWLHLRYWFRVHMACGVLAPTAILFHSGFSFGSPNSTVALICLLMVATSGLIGRFLYNRVHAGVYGEKIKLAQVRRDFITLKKALADMAVTEKQKSQCERLFEALEDLIVAQDNASFATLWRSRKRARKIARALKDLIRGIEQYHIAHPEAHKGLAQTRRDVHNCAAVMLAILKKLPGLHLFERLFSLWHVVHLPIFGLMLITAVTHVIVVHMY